MPLTAHRQWLMEGAYQGAVFDYRPQRGHSFVLSGTFEDYPHAHRKKYSGRHLRPVVGTSIPVKLSTATHEDQRPEMLRRNETAENVGILE